MQNTRLNRLVDSSLSRLTGWLRNPWRKLSVVIIGVLFGNLLASVLSSTTGQTAEWDSLVAILLILTTELVNRFVYGRSPQASPPKVSFPLWRELFNAIKIGFIYGMFVQALILGS
jgi:hypothetical protein